MIINKKEDAVADLKDTPLADMVFLLKFMSAKTNSSFQFLEQEIEKELVRRGRLIHFGKGEE